MSQNKALIEGTNIPQDPRKRNRCQGRLDITIWVECTEEELNREGALDVTATLRKIVPELKSDFELMLGNLQSFRSVEIRVSK